MGIANPAIWEHYLQHNLPGRLFPTARPVIMGQTWSQRLFTACPGSVQRTMAAGGCPVVALAITTCIASINVSYRLCPQGQTDSNSIGMLLLSLSHQSSTCRTDCGSLSGNLAAVAMSGGPTTGLEFDVPAPCWLRYRYTVRHAPPGTETLQPYRRRGGWV